MLACCMYAKLDAILVRASPLTAMLQLRRAGNTKSCKDVTFHK